MNDRKSEIEETIITLFKEDKDLGWWAAFRAKRLLSKYNDSNACDVDLYPTIYNEFANLLGEGPLQDYLFTNHVEYLTIRCYKYKDNNDV